jgi:N-acetylmuramoyl-L-alanine amidase
MEKLNRFLRNKNLKKINLDRVFSRFGRLATSTAFAVFALTLVTTSVARADSDPFTQNPLRIGVPQSALLSSSDEAPAVTPIDTDAVRVTLADPQTAIASALNNQVSEQRDANQFQGMRVGIQAGHWKAASAPDELASLRTATGASSAGVREVDMNLKVAQQVKVILESHGVQVDLLSTALPVKYQADAFVAIHADANGSTAVNGFKAASGSNSATKQQDQALVQDLYSEYTTTTGMPTDDSFTDNMYYYYAFNASNRQHTVAPTTPAAIVEMGFLTNRGDRDMIVNHSDVIAQGIAQGIMDYLSDQQAGQS